MSAALSVFALLALATPHNGQDNAGALRKHTPAPDHRGHQRIPGALASHMRTQQLWGPDTHNKQGPIQERPGTDAHQSPELLLAAWAGADSDVAGALNVADAAPMWRYVRNHHSWELPRLGANHLIIGYGFALVIMMVSVAIMNRNLGASAVVHAVFYTCALALVKLSVRRVFFRYSFFYPKFLTLLHMMSSSLAGFVMMTYRRLSFGQDIVVPSGREVVISILPLAVMCTLAMGLENTALLYCSAAFSEVIGVCCSVASALLLHLQFSRRISFHHGLLMSICVMIAGCLTSFLGEMRFSFLGTLLLILSGLCQNMLVVMQEVLLTLEDKASFDPVTSAAWTYMCSSFLLLMWCVVSEGSTPLEELAAPMDGRDRVVAITVSCVVALIMNISGFFVWKVSGLASIQTLGQVKSILVVMGGTILLDEKFTPREYVGFGAVVIGSFWYKSLETRLAGNLQLLQRARLDTCI